MGADTDPGSHAMYYSVTLDLIDDGGGGGNRNYICQLQ